MKRMKWKRLGAVMLTLAMLLSVVPGAALAVEAQPQEADAAQVRAGTYPIHVTSDEGLAYVCIRHPDGSKTDVNEAEPGQKLYVVFSDFDMTPGTAFVKWVDDGGNLTDLSNVTSYKDCSFTMPEGEVNIHAELAQNSPKITVENGTVKVPYGVDYAVLNHPYVTPGREVTLYFDDSKTPAGKTFKEWYVKSGDVVLSDPGGRENCSFTVPNHDVEIGVRYEDAYAISVENGYAQYYLPNGDYIWNTRFAMPGTQMYLKVNPYTKPEGMAFSKWVVKKGNVQLDQPYSSYSCPFIMPGEEVEIAAEFVPGHAVVVNNGDICKTIPGGEYDWYIDMAAPGDQVWAFYDAEDYPAPAGMEFARWRVTKGNVQLDDPEAKVCSFTMPDEAVEVSAVFKPEGSKNPVGWQQIGSNWFYFAENGSMLTGWQQLGGNWFYFAENGSMLTGWQPIGGFWFYLDGNGHMMTGWQQIGGNWFYLDENGHMLTGWQWIDGKCYYFYDSGAMATSTWIGGSYVDGSGAWVQNPVATGWQSDSIGWWYNDENGSYVTGWQTINGNWYYFSGNGYMQTGWQIINGAWYYFDGNGHMMTGWQQIGGNWYYLSNDGYMRTGWWQIGGNWFYFAENGSMQTGWQQIGGFWFYFAENGHRMTGWQWIDGQCYYFYNSGAMASNTWIDGSYVNGSGVWVQ